jgi:hypothetical protein
MNSYQKDCLQFLQDFSGKLKEKKLSKKYHLEYIKLYLELNGTKQRIKYLRLSELWNVHKDTARNIIKIFVEFNVLKKSQQTDDKEDDNRGYLFIEPLVHPQEEKSNL